MNLCRETVKMGLPPGNRRGLNPRRTFKYVAGFKPRGRPGGRSYSRSQQPIHELSGLVDTTLFDPLQQLLGSVHIIGSVNIDKGESLGIQLPNFF